MLLLLTINTTYQLAMDIGFLLHKNPANVLSFPLSFGRARVFYPEASSERCTAALLLDIDAVYLVRGGNDMVLERYVNDRPYVASSFMKPFGRSSKRVTLCQRPQHTISSPDPEYKLKKLRRGPNNRQTLFSSFDPLPTEERSRNYRCPARQGRAE